MKQLQIVLILFLFSSYNLLGQGWEKLYPAPVDTFLTGLVTADKTPNGDIVILEEGYEQILKLDVNGVASWIPIPEVGGKQYNNNNPWNDIITENYPKDNLIATTDGNFITVDDGYGLILNLGASMDSIQIIKYTPT